jgi:hypothetical protein
MKRGRPKEEPNISITKQMSAKASPYMDFFLNSKARELLGMNRVVILATRDGFLIREPSIDDKRIYKIALNKRTGGSKIRFPFIDECFLGRYNIEGENGEFILTKKDGI